MAGANDGQLIYNFSTMGDAVTAINTAVSNMRSTLSQLESDLRPLEGDAWSSVAQEQYRIRKDRWQKASDHIAMLLERVKASLAQASERMQNTDQRAAQYFQ
ncbi:MAG: WXG100 family type VII secretion target [Micromonosporaceae bacterium]|nr:WXG100 family type VII secretion target [Micromonosporaceae bacterium]